MVAVLALAVGATLASSSVAWADEAEGRRRWSRGRELYEKGRYVEAAREFEAGYAAAPRPLFLLNIGHAYRRAQELVKAKSAYQQLLRLQPDYPQRAEVEGYIKSIDDVLQAAEAGTEASAARPPSASARPAPPPAPAPSLTLVDPSSAPPPPKPMPSTFAEEPLGNPALVGRPAPADEPPAGSVLRKPWFWVVVGAVVAGGIATAVIVARPGSPCPAPATACFREPP